ncbi:hypothetical protein CEXT_10591 [Caerostris extrusa]|uniref:Uncharacterized protein n=1 Tax=Caerostris extrusa TaxID=172846 RepID=A0AAV4P3P6_CAEEX|nr:hypothetical protein CEXT_10591 [Caerostris extrusa]
MGVSAMQFIMNGRQMFAEAVVLALSHPDGTEKVVCHDRIRVPPKVNDHFLCVRHPTRCSIQEEIAIKPFLRDNIRCRTRVWPESLLRRLWSRRMDCSLSIF